MIAVKITMVLKKSTENKFKYVALDRNAPIENVYIDQTFFEKLDIDPPQEVDIDIEITK